MITKIISGGQTGADIAGLRAAKRYNIETGGFAPRGWLTENGPDTVLRDFYGLLECPEPKGEKPQLMPQCKWEGILYSQRTQRNAAQSDATLWFGLGTEIYSRGFVATRNAASHSGVPFHKIFRGDGRPYDPKSTAGFLKQYWNMRPIEIVNVAGNRLSKAPGIEEWVESYLCEVFELLGFKRKGNA